MNSENHSNLNKNPSKYFYNQDLPPDYRKSQRTETDTTELPEAPLTKGSKTPNHLNSGKGDITKYMNCARGMNLGHKGQAPNKIVPNSGRAAVPTIVHPAGLNSINKINKNSMTEMVQGVGNYTRNLKSGAVNPMVLPNAGNIAKSGEYLQKKGSEKNMRTNQQFVNFKNSIKKQGGYMGRTSPTEGAQNPNNSWGNGSKQGPLLPPTINNRLAGDFESDESAESLPHTGL